MTDPTPAELLRIIERARDDKRRREALDRYWQAVADASVDLEQEADALQWWRSQQ